jgi:hypothetical protein
MPVFEGLGPYVEQLFDNEDVQDNVRRAVARAQQALARARGRKSTKQALTDRGVQERIRQSVVAAFDAIAAIARGPEIERAKEMQRRRRRRNRLLGLAVLVGGTYAAYRASAPPEKERADV